MKRTVLLFTLALILVKANAQVLLNEVYTDPANGKHEFFELYNTSTSNTPENLDCYTVVTYYEESGKAGFYVLDMPNQTINARGYHVTASSLIFNVQSQAGLVADLSYNLVPASGSLTKWEKSGTGYIQRVVPLGLNDFFNRTSGSGGSYHIFIFKNGVLVNALIAAISASSIPAYIKSMPSLPVDMAGSCPDFTINFAALNDNLCEYVIPATGSDNGYVRMNDGQCGGWDKSSSSSEHTPGATNGSAAGQVGQITITASITFGAQITDPSILHYNITAGPAYMFPVTVEAYRDLGTIGQLDQNDILFDSRVIANTSAGVQNITLVNPYEQVILVLKTPSGCLDRVMPVANYRAVLPVRLTAFTVSLNNDKAELTWTTESEENLSHFVIEKSTDGVSFGDAGVMVADESNRGSETYHFTDDLFNTTSKMVYYRLRSVDMDARFTLSETRILQLTKKTGNALNLLVYPNPVSRELWVSLPASWQNKKVSYEIFSANGMAVGKQEVTSYKQSEKIDLSNLRPGLYIIRVSCNGQSAQQKLIKN